MNQFQRIVSIIKGWFINPNIIEDSESEKIKTTKRIRPAATACAICKKQINTLTGYYCEYCKQWHCSEHKLPETHNCENPDNPYISFGK